MRRNSFLILAASALLLAAPSASRAEKGAMRPGQYEMKTEVKIEGVDQAMPPTTSTRCYTEADIKDSKKMTEGGPQPRLRDCRRQDDRHRHDMDDELQERNEGERRDDVSRRRL